MGQLEPEVHGRRFGRYLRRIREDRKLSLDAVEERSLGMPERITKSHLSRIETGQAVPSFPRLWALSRIYGVPIAQFAERFDLDLRTGDAAGVDIVAEPERVAEQLEELMRAGDYTKALAISEVALDAVDAHGAEIPACNRLRLYRISCLLHVGSYHSAKDECEVLLGRDDLEPGQRVRAYTMMAQCGYRLGRFIIARMALDRAEAHLDTISIDDPFRARFALFQGNVAHAQKRYAEAVGSYHEAIEQLDAAGDAFAACRARVNLCSSLIERGQLREARRQLGEVVKLARRGGYDRQLALALSNLALISYREEDADSAESCCLQSNSIARQRDYADVVFRNCYYLRKIAQSKGDDAGVRSNTRSLRSLIGRVDESLPEAVAFRDDLARSHV